MNDISEIWNMTQDKNLVLTFDKDVNLHEIYHEAYVNNLWVSVDHNPYKQTTVVKVLNEHKCDDIAEQMVNAVIFDNELKPFYNGELNQTSLRTALYRAARKLRTNVKTGTHNSVLYCYFNIAETVDLDKDFKEFKKAGVFEVNIEIPEGTDIKKLRSNVFNYTARKGLKVKTRVIGNKLRVTRLLELNPSEVESSSSVFRKWLSDAPFDTPLPLPEINGLKGSSMTVIANRTLGCAVTVDKGLLCKHSYRMSKEKGCMTLRIKGVVSFRSEVSRRNQLTSEEWVKIDKILSHYGVTSEVL